MATRVMRAPRRAPSGRVVLRSGPWVGVRHTREPFDDPPNLLVDARNGYLVDPQHGSGFYQRPGFALANGGTAVHTASSAFSGQGIYSHPMLDGSTINFLVFGGKLYRVNASLSLFEDVTPSGITIDASRSTRVYFASVIGQLIVTDGVHRPWIGSDLTSTPITGTAIDYDGTGTAWTAFGAPTLYQNAVFFILNSVNSISRRTDLAWSEPGQPSVGYQQTDYDNNWTLETASSGPLYAIQGTNTALYYWRALSIGTVTGTVGPDLASTATEDAIGFNVGAQASQTIQQFGTGFFFCDAIGRPWRFQPGAAPEPIWYQLRAIVDSASLAYPTTTAQVATAVVEPTLNKWLVGLWSPQPALAASVTELHVFDAATGTYEGRWSIGPGIAIDCIGSLTDASGRVTIVVLGSKTTATATVLATSGYVWTMNSLSTVPAGLLEEDGDTVLQTEAGVDLTTEGQTAIWGDDGQLPDVRVQTGRLGYADDTVLHVDQATLITGTDAPVQLALRSSAVESTVEGYPQPAASQDGTYRLVAGCDLVGRGPQVSASPRTAREQWALYGVSLTAIATRAGWEDA